MPDELLPRDLHKPEILTGLVERRVKEADRWDIQDFAPIVKVKNKKVKVRIREGNVSGLGQFRAENAPTPLTAGYGKGEEVEIEIPILAEKTIIDEDTLTNLDSIDPEIAKGAARDVVKDATGLRIANINLTRFMAFRGALDLLVIVYPNGQQLGIDYGMNNADGRLSGSHLPIALLPWTDPDADILSDIDAWALMIADDHGAAKDELILKISSRIWNAIRTNTAIMKRVGTSADPKEPDMSKAADILGIKEIKTYDKRYEDKAKQKHRYLPENRALLYAPDSGDQPTIQVLDGPIPQFKDGRVVVNNNPGAMSEIWAQPDPVVENLRVQTRRLPVVLREGVVSGTVA